MASGHAGGDHLPLTGGPQHGAISAGDQQDGQRGCHHRSLQCLQLAAAAPAADLLGASKKRLSSLRRARRQIGGGGSGTARTDQSAVRALASVARWTDYSVNLATPGKAHSASRQTTARGGHWEQSCENAAYLCQHLASGSLSMDVRANKWRRADEQ